MVVFYPPLSPPPIIANVVYGDPLTNCKYPPSCNSMLTEIDVEVVLGVLGRLLGECVQRLVVQVPQVAHRGRAPVLAARGRILGRSGRPLRVVRLVVGVPSSISGLPLSTPTGFSGF